MLLGRPASTVGKVLRRWGHSRLPCLPRPPRPPVVRYGRAQPGELLHLDTKKLARCWHVGKRIRQDGIRRSPRAGWQQVHVANDDHSRLAYAFAYPTSAHRTRAPLGWLRWYNRRRPHGALGGLPPISRVSHLCGQYT
ncbi:MAG: integrase core domain-containing protein [Chloroflexi bacterium]|nr:integrase core domain-containing protein [Chloroflexota bacterium]